MGTINLTKYLCLVAATGVCFTVRGVNSEVQKSTLMLWSAVERNDPTAARDAIESWANVEWRNGSGFNALHLAAASGHVEAVSVLLTAGADKEASTNSGDKPLHLAAANGRDAVVSVLIVAGADIKSAGYQGRTPLLEAIQNGKTSTVALIRALSYSCINGTTVQASSPSGITSNVQIGEATGLSSTQFAPSSTSQVLLTTELPSTSKNASQVQRSAKEIKEATDALWRAVEGNDTAAVRSAIERGADLNSRGDFGMNVLHEAAAKGHVEIMDVLVKAGISLESEDRDGDRPIHWAARRGTEEAIRWLAKAGADIRAPGRDDMVPVQVADLLENIDTKTTLINLGALL